MRYPLPWFPLSEGTSRCSCRTTRVIGHLTRDADLVAVEVEGLLFAFTVFVGPVSDLCQRFVAAGIGVDIGISAVRVDFL